MNTVVSYRWGTCGDFIRLLLLSGHPEIKNVTVNDPDIALTNIDDLTFTAHLFRQGKVHISKYINRTDNFSQDVNFDLDTINIRPVIFSGHYHIWILNQKQYDWPSTKRYFDNWLKDKKIDLIVFIKCSTEKSYRISLINDWHKNLGKEKLEDKLKRELETTRKHSKDEIEFYNNYDALVLELEDIYNKEYLMNELKKVKWWNSKYFDSIYDVYMSHQPNEIND